MALVSALLGGALRARALYAHAVELLVRNASRPVSTGPISLHLLLKLIFRFREQVARRYRFLSYGDASFLARA